MTAPDAPKEGSVGFELWDFEACLGTCEFVDSGVCLVATPLVQPCKQLPEPPAKIHHEANATGRFLRVPPLSWEPIPKHHLPLLISKIYRAQDEDIRLREDFGMLESNVHVDESWLGRTCRCVEAEVTEALYNATGCNQDYPESVSSHHFVMAPLSFSKHWALLAKPAPLVTV